MAPKATHQQSTVKPRKTNAKSSKDSDDDESLRQGKITARPGSSAKSNTSSLSKYVDWYLFNIVGHLLFFALIGVADLYSDFTADVCYQCLGITIAVIRVSYPDSFLVGELVNFRIATRVLRPVSLWKLFLARSASDGLWNPKTMYTAANTIHDASLVAVGLCILFQLSRIDIVKALYRESWFVMACLRFVISLGDPLATASCVLEILATNCLIFVLVTGGKTVPPRLLGVLGFCVGSQKLWYLIR